MTAPTVPWLPDRPTGPGARVARAAGLVAGLLLAVAGVAGLAHVGMAAADVGELLPVGAWGRALAAARFGDPAVLSASVALLVIGLVLVASRLAVRRRRPARAPLAAHAGPGRWWVARRSAERYVADSVLATTTATSATVKVTPGPTDDVPWRLVLRATGPDAARVEVERRTGGALARLGAPDGSTVRVRFRVRGS